MMFNPCVPSLFEEEEEFNDINEKKTYNLQEYRYIIIHMLPNLTDIDSQYIFNEVNLLFLIYLTLKSYFSLFF